MRFAAARQKAGRQRERMCGVVRERGAAAGRTLTGWTRLTFKRERKVGGFVGTAQRVINVRRSIHAYQRELSPPVIPRVSRGNQNEPKRLMT